MFSKILFSEFEYEKLTSFISIILLKAKLLFKFKFFILLSLLNSSAIATNEGIYIIFIRIALH